jgi:hypothetical protein
MTAVKKTVVPIPVFGLFSFEQPSRISLSAPEQRMKNCFNMIDFFLDVVNLAPKNQQCYKSPDLFPLEVLSIKKELSHGNSSFF